MRHLCRALALAAMPLTACQSTTYETKLPPDDYFDPGNPNSKGYGYGGDGGNSVIPSDSAWKSLTSATRCSLAAPSESEGVGPETLRRPDF